MKTSTWRILAVPFLASLLAACGPKSDGAQAQPGATPPPPEVDVVTVAPDSVLVTRDLPGRLEAYRTAQVRARVEGIIERRLFTEGSDVRPGDMLFQIDARNYQAAYDSARADAEVARLTVTRYRPLLAGNVVSQQDYDMVAARLKQAEAALARAQIDLENTHVPAPLAGHVGRTLVTEGALVGRGEATLLTTIEQIDPIYANFTQAGVDVLRLQRAFQSGKLKRAGSAKVELVLEDGSVYPRSGKLLFTNLAVDPGTGSVLLRAEFPNPRHELLPGMFVRIRFPEGVTDNTIRVPQRAVQAGAQGQYVMVVDASGVVAPRPIRTNAMSGGDFIVAEGLNPGDQVIVNGLQKVRPGSPAKPVAWVEPGSDAASAVGAKR